MEPLLLEPEVNEIIYPPNEKFCDKCKLCLIWVAVWSIGFTFGFLSKDYLQENNESCNGSM